MDTTKGGQDTTKNTGARPATFDMIPGPHSDPPRTPPRTDDGSSHFVSSFTPYAKGTADHEVDHEEAAKRSQVAPFLRFDLSPERCHKVTMEEFLKEALRDPGEAKLKADGIMNKLNTIAESSEFQQRFKDFRKKVLIEDDRYPLFVDLFNYAVKALVDQKLTEDKLGLMLCVNHPVPVRGSRSSRIPDVNGVLRRAIAFRMTKEAQVDWKEAESAGRGKKKKKEKADQRGLEVTNARDKGKGKSTMHDEELVLFSWEQVAEGAKRKPFFAYAWPDCLFFTEFKMISSSLLTQAEKEAAENQTGMKRGSGRGNRTVTRSVRSGSNTAVSNTTTSEITTTTSSKRQLSDFDDHGVEGAAKRTKTDIKSVEEYRLQCADYAMNMLDRGGIRTHAIGSLVVDGKLELFLYTRSRTCRTEPFSFIDNATCFLRIVLAFSKLTLADWGVPDLIQPLTLSHPRLPMAKQLVPDRFMYVGVEFVLDGTRFRVGPIGIFPRGLISRGTWTLEIEVVDGKLHDQVGQGVELFMKLSAISKKRHPEHGFIQQAEGIAIGEHAWASNHLPKVYASGVIPTVSTFQELFGSESGFELRELRYMIMERLYPITDLVEPKVFARAFRDTIRCHQWLVTTPGIMHRDISVNNLMYRQKGKQEKVYGVLNDFDLACWMEKDENAGPTSHQRTGTKPFIALELLEPDETPFQQASIHRARFELESFLYVFAWIVCRYDNKEEIANPPFEEWSQGTWKDVYDKKVSWFERVKQPPLTDTYKSLKQILFHLKTFVKNGRQAVSNYTIAQESLIYTSTLHLPPQEPVDPETLGGNITYEKILSSFDGMGLDD